MKILVIGSLAHSLVNFRGELLKDMSKYHEVVACAPNIPDTIREQLECVGVRCREIKLNRTGLTPIADLKTLLEFTRIFREEKPDRILTYTIKPVLYGSLAARIIGIKGVYSMITGLGYAFTKEKGLKPWLISVIVNILYKHALKGNSYIFFQNPDDMELFKDRGLTCCHEQSVLINGSGVDVDFFTPAKYPDAVSFLLIARLIRTKGIYEYAAAARIIRDKYPRIKFRLAGWMDSNPDSIKEGDLQSWRESGDIEFLGKLEDVRKAIEGCSVYVLPSYREGTPRTVLEAMAMGRPIITTDAPGCRETVVPGMNGFLVPVCDVDSLVKAMERFILSRELLKSMGQASRKIAKEKYDVRKVNTIIMHTMGLAPVAFLPFSKDI